MKLDWWTLGLQALNVLVLVWLLGHFFWRPLSEMIRRRQDEANRLLDDAQIRRDDAVHLQEQARGAAQQLEEGRATALARVEEQAREQRDAELARTAQQARELLDAAREDVARTHAQAAAQWRSEAAELALHIAQRLAQRLDGAAVHEAFVGWLLQQLREIPDAERASLLHAPLLLRSAGALDAVQQQRCRQALAELLGAPPQLRFDVDPDLIQGLELHGPGLRVRNSWRADLDSIADSLRGPDHADA